MEDTRLMETLEFQADQAYAALERATKTLFLPDAKYANILYRDSMEPLLKKMIEDEQGKKTYQPSWEKKKRDFHIINYARSEFERFVLEYMVGANLAQGITYLDDLSNYGCHGRESGSRKIADEKKRDDALFMAQLDVRSISIKDLAESYKDGSWKENRDFGLDEKGKPKETTYDRFYLMTAAGSCHLLALGDCPQARKIVQILSLIPKIRQLYSFL